MPQHDDSYEFLNPTTEEYEEKEFTIEYSIQPAEPDVGIMSSYIDEWFFRANCPLTQEEQKIIEQDTAFVERMLERAADYGFDDYGNSWDDYDRYED